MRISPERRQQTEDRIRAAMDRLLRGELPPEGKCDIKTLAHEAAVTRAALYSTYLHLKDEFEQRRDKLRQSGVITDPREAQITGLKQTVDKLRARNTVQQNRITELTQFRTTALSQLAAQHEEILRLRAAMLRQGNVRALPRRNS
ncbi:hypothetical protein AB0M45_31425 [Nocardia sp. NPDC051787]|uniref:hypothetical protein n=1 Tax=Nocardia sp. NPDC051787 TaxID=3155415 RepID=UPI003420AAF4